MKLLAFVGSLRKESFNLQLAKTIQDRYKDQFELEIVDLQLPLFDQDQELDAPPAVRKLREQVMQADGVIMITPEYNWSVSGVLKNALDWLSRVEKPLIGKPVMTAGVSPGLLGTIRAQIHLRDILASPGINVKLLPPAGHEIVINQAQTKFDEATGQLTDANTLAYLDGVMSRFVEFVKQN